MKELKKRGQEEIIGFVLIMIIIAVIFLVFLGISLRSGGRNNTIESIEIYQFLESSMELTTFCSYSSGYYKLGELFEKCYAGINCLSGEDSCVVLNSTLTEILGESWNIEEESYITGYEFRSAFVLNNATKQDEIILVKIGECADSFQGASFLIPAFPGKIENTFKLCR